MQIKLISLLTLLCLSSIAFSADQLGNYAIWGKGNKSCYKYENVRLAGKDEAFRHYVMGYLTAYNTVTDKTYSISSAMNLENIMSWLDDYCAEKKVHGFEQALTSFIVEHYKKRHKVPPGGVGR